MNLMDTVVRLVKKYPAASLAGAFLFLAVWTCVDAAAHPSEATAYQAMAAMGVTAWWARVADRTGQLDGAKQAIRGFLR